MLVQEARGARCACTDVTCIQSMLHVVVFSSRWGKPVSFPDTSLGALQQEEDDLRAGQPQVGTLCPQPVRGKFDLPWRAYDEIF